MIRRRQLQMAPAALLAHAVVTLCATSIALALASDVAPPPSAADSTRVAALVTLLRLCSRASEPLRYVALPAFIVLASAPWLLAIWLRAGEIDEPLTEHARAVRALYLRALALWASCAAYAGALILVALALFHVASRAFDTPPARMIGGVVVALPFLFALIHPLTLLDSANLALVRGAPTVAIALREGRVSIGRRLLLLRGAFLVASAVIALFGVALRAQLGWSVAGGLGTFCLGQLGALLALALRNLWLAILSNRHET